MQKFLWAFAALSLVLLCGFRLLLEHGRGVVQGTGACMMIGAMVAGAAIDIRLRGALIRKTS